MKSALKGTLLSILALVAILLVSPPVFGQSSQPSSTSSTPAQPPSSTSSTPAQPPSSTSSTPAQPPSSTSSTPSSSSNTNSYTTRSSPGIIPSTPNLATTSSDLASTHSNQFGSTTNIGESKDGQISATAIGIGLIAVLGVLGFWTTMRHRKYPKFQTA